MNTETGKALKDFLLAFFILALLGLGISLWHGFGLSQTLGALFVVTAPTPLFSIGFFPLITEWKDKIRDRKSKK